VRNIVIIIADEGEYRPFIEFAGEYGAKETGTPLFRRADFDCAGNHIIIALSGVGKVNAAAAAAYLIASESVDAMLNAGYSGGIRGVSRGDIIAGASYAECDFDITATGRRPGEKPGEPLYAADAGLLKKALKMGIKSGDFGTGDIFLTDSAKKRHFADTFGICAFDMESAAIASVCARSGAPFLSVRKISDSADGAALSDYREMNADSNEKQLADVVMGFIKQP